MNGASIFFSAMGTFVLVFVMMLFILDDDIREAPLPDCECVMPEEQPDLHEDAVKAGKDFASYGIHQCGGSFDKVTITEEGITYHCADGDDVVYSF